VGWAGGQALTTVFREASITSLFAVPVRNAFSEQGERFGLDSKIDPDRLALGERISDRDLERLQLFGVTAIAVGSASMKARLDADDRFVPVSPPGSNRLYAIPSLAGPLATIPARGPVLTFAPWSVKPRPAEELDFVRLAEEAIASGWLDAPLVRARTGRLDTEALEPFPAVLIAKYEADDSARALARLTDYVRGGGKLVLLERPGPLFERLRMLEAEPGVRVVLDAHGSVAGATSRAGVEEQANVLFAALDALLPAGQPPAKVASTRLDHDTTKVVLDNPTRARVPVYLKQSHFPDWQSDGGEDVYLASPSFQLAFTNAGSLTLRRKPGPMPSVAALASLLGLVWIGWLSRPRAAR
jgi:hypothetical protein